jgi:hypothetical protein
MSVDYDKMTQEEYDKILWSICMDEGINKILNLAGVYEIVSEEYNNDVLDRWENMQSD